MTNYIYIYNIIISVIIITKILRKNFEMDRYYHNGCLGAFCQGNVLCKNLDFKQQSSSCKASPLPFLSSRFKYRLCILFMQKH